ncbi:uncharacterized protein PADG_05278 [Paracoccidioides brasiliensis Pb18]|uniref:Uncharacterized protein n=1 Tax=Paracoccidioides brasiliensis (strain Pb18) TaxID=502780 RepID=C1GDE2_PARBD|nr:uncharacterized protein PADG_05278 [Paracoccidioides brasiliensis Pb18]EEH49199.2 hypothetical protein PADG_05278 [Paracoccidioides brasiliensis Pb18]
MAGSRRENMSEIVVKDELERGTNTAPPGRIDLRLDSMVSSVCEAAREHQAGHDIPAQSWSTLLLFNGLVSGIWHLVSPLDPSESWRIESNVHFIQCIPQACVVCGSVILI